MNVVLTLPSPYPIIRYSSHQHLMERPSGQRQKVSNFVLVHTRKACRGEHAPIHNSQVQPRREQTRHRCSVQTTRVLPGYILLGLYCTVANTSNVAEFYSLFDITIYQALQTPPENRLSPRRHAQKPTGTIHKHQQASGRSGELIAPDDCHAQQ